MGDSLSSYRAKRDFDATPEPSGEPTDEPGEAPRFVVHEHHARRLHWDLRLEHDGTLASWALPRGIPEDPKANRLAVRTEDHPLEYLDFSGEIPRGSYGAGQMHIWDQGTYEPHKFRADEVIATFHGERLRGKYAVFQTRGQDWMIHRMDPPVDPHREPMPEAVAPMLAVLGELPRDEDAYGYEIKWDGVRAIARYEPGRLTLASRNGRDITRRYPELRALGSALGAHSAILDGEIVVFDDQGRPSFELLQRRMHVESETAVRRLRDQLPVVYMIFDLLYLDGHSTAPLQYSERRELLSALELSGPSWQTPAYHVGEGAALLEASEQRGLEGIVAKRLDCPYEPGRRSSAWIKVKNHRVTRVVIGGWLEGQGRRSGRVGALVTGFHDRAPDGSSRLAYAGKVGTGFSERMLDELAQRLAPLARSTSPFGGRQPPRGARFVEPRLVAEVEFTEWTHARTLRHPSFKRLVPDANPQEVVFDGGE